MLSDEGGVGTMSSSVRRCRSSIGRFVGTTAATRLVDRVAARFFALPLFFRAPDGRVRADLLGEARLRRAAGREFERFVAFFLAAGLRFAMTQALLKP